MRVVDISFVFDEEAIDRALEEILGGTLGFDDYYSRNYSRTRARQEVFVFSLHLFTGMTQMIVAQRVKGEGFLFLGSRWGWWGSPR